MAGLYSFALFVALRCLLLTSSSTPVVGAPVASADAASSTSTSSSSSFWMASITRQGTAAFGSDSYTIFRNVQDYGATGNGVDDDTDAINSAISDGSRCGEGCDSTTVTPAIVYFPPGTYLVSAPIVQYYYTQLVGDAIDPPTLLASSSFSGMAVIDADKYNDDGSNWYTNQNNFFRQVRNFVIDLTSMPSSSGAGIHWQVAQATSLQNIVFNMIEGGDDNAQEGIFMDNGSGGFMTDLVFNGGKYGAFLGSQQFTSRNLTFNNCKTAMFVNWDWVWTFKSIEVNNCEVGINMSVTGTTGQADGSVLLLDSVISATEGIITSYDLESNDPTSAGSLVLNNVDFSGSTTAVSDASGNTILAGGSTVDEWTQGRIYIAESIGGSGYSSIGTSVQSTISLGNTRPSSLLDSSGYIVERSRPQYEGYAASSFISVKSNGAAGDGSTDDTDAIQSILDSAAGTDNIVYFDHGAYLVTSTIKVPANVKITGEIWPLIMASGDYFSDMSDPHPVFQVGEAGETGHVEISDIIFETKGPAPGAVMIEWNLACSEAGQCGLWDTHVRIGGSAGTELQSDTCVKNNLTTHDANADCEGSFLLLHITEDASSVYLENTWFWVADHELDLSDHNQIDIYNGRGVLIESTDGPVWMYGVSAEHSTLYNFQLNGAGNVFMGVIQTETAYFQSNPDALDPFTPNTTWSDPTFSSCTTETCIKTWGLRIRDSSNVLMFGAGLYSFFENYGQTCLDSENCQVNMVGIGGTNTNVELWGLSTKAATNMVIDEDTNTVLALQADNRAVYCSTISLFEIAASS